MPKKLTIVSVAAEVAPFSKGGGLGDVARSLPKALKRLGHNVIVITPLHGIVDQKKHKVKLVEKKIKLGIDESTVMYFDYYQSELMPGLPIYFIDYPPLFSNHKTIYRSKNPAERFYFFNFAAVKLLQHLNLKADIIQAHDWHSGLVPYFIKKRFAKDPLFARAALLYTIHNLAYQGGSNKPLKDDGFTRIPRFKDKEKLKSLNFAKRAIINADIINTVSEQYAKEILTPEFGERLYKILRSRKDRLYGIVNGIDYNDFNPEKDPHVHKKYSVKTLKTKQINKLWLQKHSGLPVDPNVPLIGIVSRIAEQKGFDLIMKIADTLMEMDLQLILVGDGDEKYESYFKKLDKKHTKFSSFLKFDIAKASQIYAGSDIFLMPSRFEPCGLGQLISLRYGSVPVVRHVGGLVNTITDYDPRTSVGNGFVFKNYDPTELLVAITRAVETYRHEREWKKLVETGMQQSHSWEIPAKKYADLFLKALKVKRTKK